MARRRIPTEPAATVTAHQVPEALLDPGSSVWASSGPFAQWCREFLGRELRFIPLADQGAYHRFTAGAEQWAALNGLEVAGERGLTDWVRLAELGVFRPRRRLVIGRGAS